MAATQHPAASGVTATVGGLPTFTGYTTVKWDTDAAGNIDMEDHKSELGEQKVRIVYEKRMTMIDFELWAVGTTPGTGSDLTDGAMCGLTGYTKYFCRCKSQPGKGITKYTGTLEKIDMSA
jgi:hypothetical protein